MKRPVIERFLEKISVDPEGCWLWKAGKFTAGYGQFWDGKNVVPASKFMLILTLGRDLLPGMEACHTCDTPACVRPSHLFEGTHQMNIVDAWRKGRCQVNAKPQRFYGERNGRSKLTDEQVDAIRNDPRRMKVIAEEYGISVSHVNKIRHGWTRPINPSANVVLQPWKKKTYRSIDDPSIAIPTR